MALDFVDNRERLVSGDVDGIEPTCGEYGSRAVLVENAWPFAAALNLDVEGVAVVHRAAAVRDYWDEAQTLAFGHPETEQLIKDDTARHAAAPKHRVPNHGLFRLIGDADASL